MPRIIERSSHLFAEATRVLVGGVNSPVRAFRRVGGTPRFIVQGRGSRVRDADGHEYIDYVGAWGSLVLGHAHPKVLTAIRAAAETGWSFGAPTEGEVRLAQAVKERMPSVELLRLVNSGTEATMSALRVARAHSKRDGFLKFEGAYHGHADPFLSRAGSGLATLGMPDSAGVPEHVAADARTVPYNDLAAAERVFRAEPEGIGAVIVEPVAANMGVVPPQPGFLLGLRELCDEHGALLIFDEVITGFRVAPGGAQELFKVRPDLTCLGKILGGGLPLAAYGGRADVMRLVSPEGPVYQAGTMSGNPIAVAAGLATLAALNGDAYADLEARSRELERGLVQACGSGAWVHRVASLLGLFLAPGPIQNWADVQRTNAHAYARLFHRLLDEGVYWAPSPYEAVFVSAAHTRGDIRATLDAVEPARSVETATLATGGAA